MTQSSQDMTSTMFTLPADAKFLPISELSPRLQSKIGPLPGNQSVITRPGFRTMVQLVPEPLAKLLSEFHNPSLLTDAVLRFSREYDQDAMEVLDHSFDAIASLIEARILVSTDSADLDAPKPALGAGEGFAGYEIEHLVRSLEDSEVYRVRTPKGEPAALKIARDDRETIANVFKNEARMLKLLAGEVTPQLFEYSVEKNVPFIAMEWCDGVSVAVAAQQVRATRDRSKLHGLVCTVLEAYARIHTKGVLHADIHPGNCLVRDDGTAVIVDFGSARLASETSGEFDLGRAGLPYFYDPLMAEAVLNGRIPPAIDAAAEQYSLCVLAYMLLTGLHPVETPAVRDDLLRTIIDRPPLPFTARGVRARPKVEKILRRGLSKEPTDRFATTECLATEFAKADQPVELGGVWPDALQGKLSQAIEDVLCLRASKQEARNRAWFALRAAIALDDVQLLAAADILASQAQPGWATVTVAAKIAQARLDKQAERAAIADFLVAVEKLPDEQDFPTALVAAAFVLDGLILRHTGAQNLPDWAIQGLDRLSSIPLAKPDSAHDAKAQLTYVALCLNKTGLIALPDTLGAHLESLANNGRGDVWLWSLAHDLTGRSEYKEHALAAKMPKNPCAHGFALLRRHQITGDPEWLSKLHDHVESSSGLSADQLTLLMIEAMAPEQAILPPIPGSITGRFPVNGPF